MTQAHLNPLNYKTILLSTLILSFGCTSDPARTVNVTQQPLQQSLTAQKQPPKKKLKRIKTPQPAPPSADLPDLSQPLSLTQEQWKQRLSKTQFRIMRLGDTEPPNSGTYLDEYREGIYHCAACNNPLFKSTAKFDSKTGWPSFFDIVGEKHITMRPDPRSKKPRTEVLCSHCLAHLGHVFDDGPQPTGLRYCVNSTSLYFRPSSK